jgi:uncharacterized protein
MAVAVVLGTFGIVGFVAGYRNAASAPIVREASISMPGWPDGDKPIRAVLISDLHVVAPDMPPGRLRRVVASINNLKPDIVLIAGDLVSDRLFATKHFDDWDSIAPLAGLRPRLATIAVFGNHDHERGIAGVRRALRRANILVLNDDARRVGPLIIGGTDDPVTKHEDFELTLSRMRMLGTGPRVVLSHGAALFPFLPADFPLMLAGHTHCGQIRLPWTSRGSSPCGITRKGARTLVVSAGVGASIVPLRFNAPPDMWLLRLGP